MYDAAQTAHGYATSLGLRLFIRRFMARRACFVHRLTPEGARSAPYTKHLALMNHLDTHAADGGLEQWLPDWRFRQSKPKLKEIEMDWNIVEGNWKQFKGKVRTQWGKLTDDQLDVIGGKRDQLMGKIQESYGITKDEAEKQIKDFEERNKDNPA